MVKQIDQILKKWLEDSIRTVNKQISEKQGELYILEEIYDKFIRDNAND